MPTAAPLAAAPDLQLPALRQRSEALLGSAGDLSAVIASDRDATLVDFFDAPPSTGDLVDNCDGGAMLSEDRRQVGLITLDVPVTSYAVDRLFRRGGPVPVSVIATDQAADGFLLARTDGQPFPIGIYALTITARGERQVLPFCVGKLIRLVDYSLIAFLPAGIAGRAARSEFISNLGGQ